MFHLDNKTGEKDKILELINYAVDNSDLELECLINNSSNRNNFNITHNNFISILKRYKGNRDFESHESTRLTITFPDSISNKYNNTRILIKGTGAINSYCNNENINLIRNSVDFEIKGRPKLRITDVKIPNYNIKFNLKTEQNFNNDDAKINDIIRDWNELMKNYRYKKTFSFIKKSGDFQIDVSIVKSSNSIDRFITVKEVKDMKLYGYVVKPEDVKTSFPIWWKTIEDKPNEKVMVRNASNYFKNIKDSSVFTNSPTYEVEIEYIKNKTTNKPRFKNINERKDYIQAEFQNLFKHIGGVLQCIQNSLYILNNDEKENVRKEFIKVVEDSINLENVSSKTTIKTTTKTTTPKKYKIKGQKGGSSGNSGNTDNSNSDEIVGTEENNTIAKLNEDGDLVYNDNENDDTEQKIINNDSKFRVDSDQEIETDETPDENKQENEDEKKEGGNIVDEDEKMKGGARKVAELKNRIGDRLRKFGIFFGPMIIDLSHNNSFPLDPEALPDPKTNTNIHINYLVTDKTDGERNLLFISGNGNVYGINRENNIVHYGLSIPGLAKTILDGEYVSRTEDDKLLNNYYIFDAYIYKGENIIGKPFLFAKPSGRHNYILETIKHFSTDGNIIQSNPRFPFMIYKKDYLPSNSPTSYMNLDADEKPLISENCEKLLNKMNVKYGGFLEVGHLYTYKTDGLVFLPNNLSVFQKSEDDIIKNPFVSGSWTNNYKWKPADLLTIDFKIEFVKDMATSRLAYRYFNDKKYLLVNLMSKIYNNKPDDVARLNFYMLNSGIKFNNLPEDFKFFSTDPFIGTYTAEGTTMGETYFEVDKNDNVICHNGEIITNGIICECGYDSSIKQEQFRWIPHRLRSDKKNANSYGTASTTWNLINNPITKEFLSGRKIEKTDEEGNLENTEYYISSSEMDILTKPFNNFSTSFVKRYVINRGLSGYVKPRVMDLSIGKFGDIANYIMAGVHTLIGIDINTDNFHNIRDNAPQRMIKANTPAINKLADRTVFIVGDTSKNIANGECVRDEINKYYLDVLYGRAPGNTTKLKKLESLCLDGFDVISLMFTIHYMLESEEKLDGFLQNVSENLLEQGYFIGTCLDGNAILQTMGRSNEIKGEIDDKTVFKIRKLSDNNEDYKNIKVGNKIGVFYEKFTREFPENLVNMSYIKERAKEHNLKLIEYKSFLEEPGNLLSQYETVNPKNAKLIRSTPALLAWAKFNSYFIFQKIRSKD